VGQETILVVDEDPDVCQVLAMILAAEGYAVATAHSGSAALDAVARVAPALIVLDAFTPRLDGWEFAARLRDVQGQRIPVLLLNAASEVEPWAGELHVVGYLGKPFHVAELVRSVHSHTAVGHREGPDAAPNTRPAPPGARTESPDAPSS
jgi:DNA-binding response OmpR family regulator